MIYKVEFCFYVENLEDIDSMFEQTSSKDMIPKDQFFYKRMRTMSGDKVLITSQQIERQDVFNDIQRIEATRQWMSVPQITAKKPNHFHN